MEKGGRRFTRKPHAREKKIPDPHRWAQLSRTKLRPELPPQLWKEGELMALQKRTTARKHHPRETYQRKD